MPGYFYPRSPCGERPGISTHCKAVSYFYPRSPCGERPPRVLREPATRRFLSTLSLRRATYNCRSGYPHTHHFYPRSPCGERRFNPFETLIILTFLSTLSLRRATRRTYQQDEEQVFLSTLSLRRATREPTAFRTPHHKFLSTLSLRRATLAGPSGPAFLFNFYPRSPCGERRPDRQKDINGRTFLSTLSLRRATL